MKVDGIIDKYKARLVVKGYRQKEGLEYFDTYSPVTMITSNRMLVELAAVHDLKIHQMDVKTVFLNGELEEEIYMEQPEGFVVPGKEEKMYRLVNSLYELKQAPKQWHAKFDQTMLANGFKINECDKCVYIKNVPNDEVINCLYVDDMLILSKDIDDINAIKRMLSNKTGEETKWLRNFLEDISFWPKPVGPICIHCDSQAAMGRTENVMYNKKSRHIRWRHNTVRQLHSSGIITIDFVKSSDNVSDPLTKCLVRETVERHLREWVTLSSRLEIPRVRFKEKNKVVTDGSTLSINSIHSHDEDNVQKQG
uniref:Retrovirus-related Pol polyprotein from transposon TNT 1-94, putative n=1 Tax=Solanum demissum TaxID=50514 RepID=Q5NRP1_SOLDE|nr:Retrovirus-related Pol polyprotein from transposon TNT 1-94, putative [Solanum demissum]